VPDQAKTLKRRLEKIDDRKLLLDGYKLIIEVQMHFNDMLMRIRNLAVTLILAVFGAAAYSLDKPLYFNLPRLGPTHISTLILVFGLVAWCSIWYTDRYYHDLLGGAVTKSRAIENEFDEDWLGMTEEITCFSRRVIWWPRPVTAKRQISIFFYGTIFVVGLLIAVLAERLPTTAENKEMRGKVTVSDHSVVPSRPHAATSPRAQPSAR
jgi:hypothetical protein